MNSANEILIGFGVLLVIIFVWIMVYYRTNIYIENPDGKARITGKCGDTMEIGLKFENDRVKEASCWTDGCIYSLNCVYAATQLAKGKTIDEILEIDPDLIQETIGGLSMDQQHCARLAYETLQAALHEFMKKQVRS
ncbi:MAG: iron-sulfur cluster assembly scaffold protein [Desulfobacteraceae bacterium]|nr:MAG: iron-sulfur cluster assembly scaffold protein [Desulfobacteraceae bacterium]